MIPAVYDEVLPFSEGLACVKLNGKWGYVDTVGNLVVRTIYFEAGPFSDGLAYVKPHGDQGYFDTYGKPVPPPFGYVDTKGNLAIPAIYASAHSFSEGLARVELNGQWGFIDTNGNMAIRPAGYCSQLGDFSEGLAGVGTGATWGYVNTRGDLVIPEIYGCGLPFGEGLAAVQHDVMHHHWEWIDARGTTLKPERHTDRAGSFSNGLAFVHIQDEYATNTMHYGFVNRRGRVVIPDVYFDALDFSEGLAAVQMWHQELLWGYIHPDGTMALPAIYDRAGSFHEGIAFVSLAHAPKRGYIDAEGTQYWED